MPLPGRAHDGVEVGVLRRPMQLRLRLVGRGVQHDRIVRTAWPERPWNRATGDALDGSDHFAHRVRMARREIVRTRLPRLYDSLERANVRIGKIRDVDVVSEARAVRRRVVVAEHLEPPTSGCRLDGARDHMNL